MYGLYVTLVVMSFNQPPHKSGLSDNGLEKLPAGVFDGLTSLMSL